MDEAMRGLGSRIVQAARMALARHMGELTLENMRRREEARLASGAGEFVSTDGEGSSEPGLKLPLADDRVPRSSLAERRAG